MQFCAVHAADLTGDGAPEIYLSNYARAPDIALDVLLVNDGTGHFTDGSDARLGELRQSAFGTSVELKDMDGDGDLDIVKNSALNSVAPWNEIGVFILFNGGDGQFESFQPVPSDSPYMFTIDDLNADGRLDFYIVNDSQDFAVLHSGASQPGDPYPLAFEKVVLDQSPRTNFLGGNVRCHDLDGDGDRDAIICDVDIDIGLCETAPGDPRKFALLRNEGVSSGELMDPFGLETNPWNTNVYDFAAIDIDRDGKLDLFLATCPGYMVMMQEDTLHVSTEQIDFGETIAREGGTAVVRVCNNGTEPVEITEISSSGSEFSTAGLETPVTLAPFECREMTVEFLPTVPANFSADLFIVAGDLSRTITLQGSAVTPPSLALDVEQLEVALAAGSATSRSVTITNPGLHLTIICNQAQGVNPNGIHHDIRAKLGIIVKTYATRTGGFSPLRSHYSRKSRLIVRISNKRAIDRNRFPDHSAIRAARIQMRTNVGVSTIIPEMDNHIIRHHHHRHHDHHHPE